MIKNLISVIFLSVSLGLLAQATILNPRLPDLNPSIPNPNPLQDFNPYDQIQRQNAAMTEAMFNEELAPIYEEIQKSNMIKMLIERGFPSQSDIYPHETAFYHQAFDEINDI